MELKDFNKDYTKTNAKSAKLNGDRVQKVLADLAKQLRDVSDAISFLQIKEKIATRDKDNDTLKTVKKELSEKNKEANTLRARLTKVQTEMKNARDAVDKYLTQMQDLAQNNPELQSQLDSAIKTKFERAIARNNSEKNALTQKVTPLKIIKNAANKDPQVSHILYGIEEDTKNIEMLQAIMAKGNKSPEDIKDCKQKIDAFTAQREAKRSQLAGYFKGTISRADIDKITYLSELNKEIKTTDRKIAGLDKQSANYQTAIRNIEAKTKAPEPTKTGLLDRLKPGQGAKPVVPGQPTQGSSDVPAVQPKWWQFIKRFKNYRIKRAAEKAAKKQGDTQSTPDPNDPTQVVDKNAFKDSMKYDVVRDYKEKLEQEYLRTAKAQNKAEKESADAKDDPDKTQQLPRTKQNDELEL